MGWLANRVNRWAGDRQQIEIDSFVKSLRGMDSPEIGMLVVAATGMRRRLESSGYAVMDPLPYTTANPRIAIFLSGTIAECQRAGKLHEAAALMVWLHTMRAAIRPEMRASAREMWGQLERGFPHALTFDADAALFPIGFDPVPQ